MLANTLLATWSDPEGINDDQGQHFTEADGHVATPEVLGDHVRPKLIGRGGMLTIECLCGFLC